jgi:hypothetical protein
MNDLVKVPTSAEHTFRLSTDAAGLCGAIVKQTARNIQGRKYVTVEGWQAIAIAHGCAAGSRDVEKIEGGVRAIGEIRRMNDGAIISVAEGFVGEDEPTWYGGTTTDRWGKTKTLPKRADYAIRAMAQTRAISRACRSAFAHVVVLIDAGLSTTPAEEVPDGGFIEEQVVERTVSPVEPAHHTPEKRRPEAPSITDVQLETLILLMDQTNVPVAEFLKVGELKKLSDLAPENFDAAKKWINKRAIELRDQKGAKPANEFADVQEIDIPY